MAELMSKEKEDLFKPDLVMVPSFRSVTGWQYVKNDKIENRQKEVCKKLPGLRSHIKHKFHFSKDDPNNNFPDTSIETLHTSAIMKNKVTGLQENFKITQRGGGLKPVAAAKN